MLRIEIEDYYTAKHLRSIGISAYGQDGNRYFTLAGFGARLYAGQL
jgi:hypothetical protein